MYVFVCVVLYRLLKLSWFMDLEPAIENK